MSPFDKHRWTSQVPHMIKGKSTKVAGKNPQNSAIQLIPFCFGKKMIG